MMKFVKSLQAVSLAIVWLFVGSAAWGQTTAVGTVQTLDRVDVNSLSTVLELELDDPARMGDFTDTGVSGTEFRACKLTALNGLFCLDGKLVKVWPTGFDDGDRTTWSDNPKTIIDCADDALALDTNKDDTCTALTVDLSGTIWLAGKNKKGPTFVLYRIVARPSEPVDFSCEVNLPGDFVTLTQYEGGVYCGEVIASDKPLLIDLNSIDGDVAEAFPLGRGVLYLEARKTAVFQPADGSSSIPIASGGKGWGLAGNEQLQSIALWQSPDGVENQILVTTDRGRVLAVAVNADESIGPPVEAFDVASGRITRDRQDRVATQCDFVNDPAYAIRTSSKSGLVYVTDRQYCEALALQPADGEPSFMLTNAQEACLDSACPPADTKDLTLSTADISGTFPPEGPTVAPGIGIDLNDCTGLCTLVVGDNGAAAATLANVTLASQESGLTLFQIKNIPDCRYVPDVCKVLLGVTDLAGVVIPLDLSDQDNPAAQRLNLTPLLPTEITDLFVDIGGLPPMYMSRFTRGQKDNGFTFEAFFGRTEDGVVFRSTFDGEFDVLALAGASLGCEPTHPAETPVAEILQWDTVTTVSERYIGTNGERVDTLINVDCGSSRTSDARWSLKPYNTEITPCTWNDGVNGVWVSDGSCAVGGAEVIDDAVFAKLLLSLYDDLGDAIDQLACMDVDGNGGIWPLSASVCGTAQAQWLNGLDKLEKCWDATQQPKQSSGSQNCQAFVSQLAGLTSTLEGATSSGPDLANRVGELQARIAVITHVYEDRFVPSIPAAGYIEPLP